MKLTCTHTNFFKNILQKKVVKTFSILLFAFCLHPSVKAQVVYAISASGNLITFNAAAPASILSSMPLTGIAAGQVVEGLDFRPATGQLYALGYRTSNGETQLYTVKTTTGNATPLGAALTLATGMANLTFDFNPTVDRIRLASSTRQNYRLNPNDGTLTATDGTLTYAASPEPNAGATPQVVTGAYISNFAGATTTTLYFYDFGFNTLGIINPPNNGTLNTVGSSGITANNVTGLDLDITTNQGTGANTAYLSADVSGSANNFYTVNLTTGAATLVGTIGGGKITEMAVLITPPIHSRTVYAVSAGNLITFNSLIPTTILSSVAITGLGSGETILGLDFRPATGQLYALGSASRLYTINLTTGAATQVGSDGAFTLNGTKFGFDFNPVPDRIRLISNTEQNLRLNPNDGTLTATDGVLSYAAGDANNGANPNAGAGAYTNSFAGSTATTLYFYDFGLQILGISNPPNNGTLNTVGGSGLVALEQGLDMDITSDKTSATNTAFLTANLGAASTNFYRVNLSTGAASLVGAIGGGSPISAMAVYVPPQPPEKLVYALTTTGNLISFSSNNPATILGSPVALTGITAGQTVEGLDFRPFNGLLYALGYNATNGQTQLYSVNVSTGAATMVGTAVTLAINIGRLAVDFNPQVDRLRVIGSTGQNYRINPNDGTLVATDTPVSYAAGDARVNALPVIHGAAYTNNFAGATSTALYYYDFNPDNLAVTLPPASPNAGVMNTVGVSGLNGVSGLDMDIITNQSTGINTTYLTANPNPTSSNFYMVDLATGEARLVGTVGSGNIVTEMAVSFPEIALPLTLTNFSIKKVGLSSELTWNTENEFNTSFFVLERSSDGRNFSGLSGNINSKAPNGVSANPLSYGYTDFAPLKGINYYRLQQVDKDGSKRYSQVLKVNFDGRFEIKLSPNPVKSILNMNGYILEMSNLQVRVNDAGGKAVIVREYKNLKGDWNAQLNVGSLQSGMYFVQVLEGTTVIHNQKVFKN